MSVVSDITGRGGIWRSAPGASEAVLLALRAKVPASLPEAYFCFLRFSNGGEGDLGVEPGWFVPWPAQDVVSYNLNYAVARLFPWFFGFGSNGGGEMFCFDCRHDLNAPIVMVPFIGMDAESVAPVASDFEHFLSFCGMPLPASAR